MYVSNREPIHTPACGVSPTGAPVRYERPSRQKRRRDALREQGYR